MPFHEARKRRLSMKTPLMNVLNRAIIALIIPAVLYLQSVSWGKGERGMTVQKVWTRGKSILLWVLSTIPVPLQDRLQLFHSVRRPRLNRILRPL